MTACMGAERVKRVEKKCCEQMFVVAGGQGVMS